MLQTASGDRAASQPQPVIAELLRTCVHPAVLNLRIERVEPQRVTAAVHADESTKDGGGPGHVVKLWLTDGQLLIQALLHRKLNTLPEIADLNPGDVVEIHEFTVRRARRKSGPGHAVYLGIENCYVIKNREQMSHERPGVVTKINKHNTEYSTAKERVVQYDAVSDTTKHGIGDHTDSVRRWDDTSSGFALDIGNDSPLAKEATIEPVLRTLQSTKRQASRDEDDVSTSRNQTMHEPSNTPPLRTADKRKFTIPGDSGCADDDDDDDTAFETVQVDTVSARKRRQVLHELSQHNASSPSRPPTRDSRVQASTLAVAPTYNQTPDRKTAVRFDLGDIGPAENFAEIFEKPVFSPQRTKTDVSAADNAAQRRDFVEQPAMDDASAVSKVSKNVCVPGFGITSSTAPSRGDSDPFHTLISLYSPSLPSKSYVFTTLIIPTYVSSHLISRPNSPFPPKRHIKVIDTSFVPKLTVRNSRTRMLGKGITVSVYRCAQDFKPMIGKVALMRGVVMQRIGGAMKQPAAGSGVGEVILNVYPTKSRIQKQSQGHGQQQSRTKLHPPEDGYSGNPSKSDGLDGVVNRSAGSYSHRNEMGDGHNTHNIGSRNSSLVTAAGGTGGAGSAGSVSNPRTESDEAHEWFVDDHDLLRREGYEVDALQAWWDHLDP